MSARGTLSAFTRPLELDDSEAPLGTVRVNNESGSAEGGELMPAVRTDIGPFAMVPEWLLYSSVSDRAIRLFAALHRHEGKGGVHPGRRRLATLLHCSLDSVDRAIRELEGAGALAVEPRVADGGDRDTNAYHLRFVRPGSRSAAATGGLTPAATGSRTDAAQTIPHMNESKENESFSADAPRVVKPKAAKPLTEDAIEELGKVFGIEVVKDAVDFWTNHQGFRFAADKPAFLERKLRERTNGSKGPLSASRNARADGHPSALQRLREAGRVVG